MSQFYARPAPIVRPPGSLGVSGTHHVPPRSPSIDPAAFGEVGPGDRVRQLAVAAMTLAMQQGNLACNGSRAVHADVTIPAPERSRRAHTLAAEALLKTSDPFEKARLANEKESNSLRAVTSAPEIELSDARGIEIRTRIEGLKPTDRVAAVIRAINRGDDSVASAVLGPDRLVTNFMSDAEIAFVRDSWAAARHPEKVARLSVLQSDHVTLTRVAEILRSYPALCAGPSIVAPLTAIPPPGHRPTIYGLDH